VGEEQDDSRPETRVAVDVTVLKETGFGMAGTGHLTAVLECGSEEAGSLVVLQDSNLADEE
jgi:hypothetical protein